jgi:hypothetical protein
LNAISKSAFAVPATIHSDHAVLFGKLLKHLRSDPGSFGVTQKTMQQNDRLARSLFDVAEADAVRVEELIRARLSKLPKSVLFSRTDTW